MIITKKLKYLGGFKNDRDLKVGEYYYVKFNDKLDREGIIITDDKVFFVLGTESDFKYFN